MSLYDAGIILISLLAVFGLYALICRLVLRLLPRGSLRLAVTDDGERTADELAALARASRIMAERSAAIRDGMAVLLDAPDPEKEDTLRKEGILVYIKQE